MHSTSIASLFLGLAVLQIGCGVSARFENRPDAPPIPTPQTSITPIPSSVPRVVKTEELLGCWSSGSGKVIRITGKQIFSSTNSFKPVNYALEKKEAEFLVLRLIHRPQFYYFQEIISLEIDKDQDPKSGFPLTIRDYRHIDDFDKGESSGISGWVKTDCKSWFRW